jgi:hypothetical protein
MEKYLGGNGDPFERVQEAAAEARTSSAFASRDRYGD